jgi:hypothetical protein
MLRRTEKSTFRIPSCKIDKDLLRLIIELLKGLRLHCFLESETVNIETDKIELLIESEWPCYISSIRIKTDDPDHSIDMYMNLANKKEFQSRVAVSGSDPVWVNGMSKQLEGVFEKRKVWYSPLSQYWQTRLPIFFVFIVFLSWELAHVLWKTAGEVASNISELQLFGIFFLVCTPLSYPLNRMIVWVFPCHEPDDSAQKWVRRFLWFLLVLLGGWLITEFLFPHLLP